MKTCTIVFDLDDTIVKEIDFLKSAFQEIAKFVDIKNLELFNQMMNWYFDNQNVFLNIQAQYAKIQIQDLKNIYRNHFPNFDSNSKNKQLLIDLKQKGYKLGLITDGFSITQRNKLKALDIENLFDMVVISEEFGSTKPDSKNFEIFEHFETQNFCYIGDNISKDFVTPNKLGWQTICLLDDGQNIHQQNFNLDSLYLPKIKIDNLNEILNFVS
jgi:putative hydrolase of the HAD superfamily